MNNFTSVVVGKEFPLKMRDELRIRYPDGHLAVVTITGLANSSPSRSEFHSSTEHRIVGTNKPRIS